MKKLYGRHVDVSKTPKNQASFDYLPLSLSERLKSESPVDIESSQLLLSAQFSALSSDSPALICARSIVGAISKHPVKSGTDSFLPASFYAKIAANVFHSTKGFDSELLLIFLKQTAMILRNAGVLYKENGTVKASRTYFESSPCAILFHSFWSYPDWADLFPSMPSAARSLQTNRFIITSILLETNEAITIDRLAANYLATTGGSSCALVLLSSFIDFTLCAFLHRFAILEYTDSQEAVEMRLTSSGRYFLKSISNS